MRTIAFVVAWTVIVLYPNVAMLFISAGRAWSPPVDPAAVQAVAATLPDDPRAIEAAVNSTIVPYAVPWQTYGVPWYFPTAQEVLERGEGDCQARAVVLASILRAKGIPAHFVGSFDHLWIEYPGKQPTSQENASVAFISQTPDAEYEVQMPTSLDLRESWQIERAYFLDAMPTSRAGALVLGWFMIAQRQRWRFRSLRLARLTNTAW